MRIIKKMTGYMVSVGSLEPFTFFQHGCRICLKLRDRNETVTDIWMPDENISGWLESSAKVRVVYTTNVIEQEAGMFPFFELKPGDVFKPLYEDRMYLRAWPANTDTLPYRAYDIEKHEFVMFEQDTKVRKFTMTSTVIMQEG